MKTKIEVEIKPFRAPNFGLLKTELGSGECGDNASSLPLAMIDADTLDKLCAEFRAEVFKKAKKSPLVYDQAEDPRIWKIKQILKGSDKTGKKLSDILEAVNT